MGNEGVFNGDFGNSQTDDSLIEAPSTAADLASFSASIEVSDSSDISESDSAYSISFYSRTLGQTKVLDLMSHDVRIVESRRGDLMALLKSFLDTRDPLSNPNFYNYPSLEFYVDPIHTIIFKAIEGSSGPRARMSDVYALSALQCDPSLCMTEHTLLRNRLEAVYPLLSWVPQRSRAYLETMLPINMNRHLGIQPRLCMSQSPHRNSTASKEQDKENNSNKKHYIQVQIGNIVHPFEKIANIPHLSTTLLSKAHVDITNELPVIVKYVCPVCSMELNVDEIVKEILMSQGVSLLERQINGLDFSDLDFPKDKFTLSKIEKAMEVNIHEAVSFLRREVSGLLQEYFCKHLAKEKLRLQGIMCSDELMEGQYRIFISELKRRLAESTL